MKRSLGILLLICLALIAIAGQSNSPQSPVEISGEPRHHPKFENEFVRVWDVTVPARDATLWHAHRNDNVVVILGAANLRIETAGAAPAEVEWKFGDVKFGKATYVHRAMNIGSTSFHNLTIELLKSTGAADSTQKSASDTRATPVLENERVRVYRVSLEPGQSTGMHTHFLPSLAVAITPAKLAVITEGKKDWTLLTLPAGDISWRGGALTHSIKNVGKTRFEGADIEMK